MEENLTVTEVNCQTGETTVRPMTSEEIASAQQIQAEEQARLAQAEMDRQQRDSLRAQAISKLQALGLTEEEISAIIA